MKPENVFLIVALSVGLVFVFLTAPFGVADEPHHFYRAYQVSQGEVYPERLPGKQYGGQLPRNFEEVTIQFRGNSIQSDIERVTFGQLLELRDLRADTSHLTPVAFTNTAVYEPVNYLPQAIGIFMARLPPGPANFLLSFYLARLMNLLVAVSLIYMAIRLMPFAKWGVVILFLTPMALFELASVSPDALTFGLTALAVAYSLSCLYPARVMNRRNLLCLAGLTLAMALLRVPYAAVAIVPLATLLYGLRRTIPLARTLLLSGLVAAGAGFLVLFWQHHFGSDVHLTVDTTINSSHQIHNLLDLPWMLAVLVRTHFTGFFNIVTNGAVGVLGWLDTPLPQWTITGFSFFLIASFFVMTPGEKYIVSPFVKRCFFGLFLVFVLAMDAIMYLYASPVRSPEIFGIQGRYYLPSLILLLVVAHGAIKLSKADWQKFHLSRLAFIGVAELVAIIVVINHSWLSF